MFSWWTAHTPILYPCFAALALSLLLAGIIFASQSDDLRRSEHTELKREVMRALRYHPLGAPGATLAADTGIDLRLLLRLLKDLKRRSLVTSSTDERRGILWRPQG